MQSHESTRTVILVGTRGPDKAMEQEMAARGVRMRWANSINAAAGLFNSAVENTAVITELALVDGNWRDLVERVRYLGRHIPIALLTSTSTAELWWDALECGVADVLAAPVSISQLSQFLRTQFPVQK